MARRRRVGFDGLYPLLAIIAVIAIFLGIKQMLSGGTGGGANLAVVSARLILNALATACQIKMISTSW